MRSRPSAPTATRTARGRPHGRPFLSKEAIPLFYERLAEQYDRIFPLAPATFAFLHRELTAASARRVLDLACGTGTYSIALARLGYETLGLDLEPAMVQQAREKALAAGVPAAFSTGDMRQPNPTGIPFDGLFCIGNSLAHLTGEDELQQALQAMYGAVRPGGVAIFQLVNYDRILARGETALPVIERDNLQFIRTYRPQSEDRLLFDSVLELSEPDGSRSRHESRVELRPIRQAALQRMLEGASFTGIRTYGDFQGAQHTSDSPATIMIGHR